MDSTCRDEKNIYELEDRLIDMSEFEQREKIEWEKQIYGSVEE